jgi:hypothetical protein
MKHPFVPTSLFLIVLILTITSGSIVAYFLFPFTSTTSSFKQVRQGGAAIVDGLSELNPNPTFEENVKEYLTAAGMYVDVYKSPSLSVDFMKSFPAGYDLVVFRVHSGTSRHGVFYFTNEQYDENKFQPEQFRDELRPARDYEGHPQVFAFGANFVNAFLRDRFRNAIVIGMGCYGAGISYGTEEEVVIEGLTAQKGPNLADAFHRQGAVAVVGWDGLVSLEFSDQASLRLIKALAVDHLTVKQAVDVTNEESGPDPVYKSVLVFYPAEGKDQVLHIQALQDGPREISERFLLSLADYATSADLAITLNTRTQAGSALRHAVPRSPQSYSSETKN